MKTAVLIFLSIAIAGCASINYSSRGGKRMVEISNSGWYLFNVIPFVSGNPEKINSCSPVFFSETATLENNIRILNDVVRRAGATGAESVKSSWSDESMFVILCKRHVIHTSAELVYDNGMKNQGVKKNANQ